MKKHLILGLALLSATAAWAQKPILVGHRGSSYGLENSVESFTNGAKRGYEYLETDFKVTKDKQLVCTHDDDLSRLGGSSLTIAGSTLAELQAVPLSQTRLGTKYTGRLCSAQEYLDVCKEQGVKPLIELKWATGINSNDQSNIPMLIKFIEDNGFRNKCIIMTSMKPCLEYIRKNYPDIELQFLTGQYWANHFDWCVNLKIDVDIQTGYFDASTVKKYHAAGLKVNMWTENTEEGYKKFGNMGCDFITTDNLDGHNLPELDPKVTFPENLVDYPEVEGSVKGMYSPEKVLDAELPAEMKGLTVRRAVINGGVWNVLASDGAGKQSIHRVDAVEGSYLGTLPMDGVAEKLGDIAFTADGALLASAVATVPFETADGNALKIYAWDTPTAAPRILVSVDHSKDILGNWSSAVCGEVFSASGKINDLKLYVSTRSASGSTYRIAGLTVKNGVVAQDQCFYCLSDDYTQTAWGDFSMTVTPRSRENILIDSYILQPVEYTFDWHATRNPLKEYARPAEGLTPDRAQGVSYLRHGIKVYALIPSCAADGSAYTATLYDITDGLDKAVAASPALHEGVGTNPPQYATTGFTRKENAVYCHIFTTAGTATFLLDTEEKVEPVETVDLELVCNWVQSAVNGNAPEHIDGTNAQQGTAVDGKFYIHDRVDKKIYVYTKDGLLGDMPGSIGYGCARDDAGNVIIRTDTQTGTEHSFMIYPAGATPANPGTPVSFTVTVPLDGQTNFINASGDLLGAGGYIYLFPNKQDGVNLIPVASGKPGTATSVSGLNFAGSTAGYVVPVNNNTMHWLYQVRTQGIYMYKSGENSAVSNARGTTTAPGRNSTGGFAYFKIRGNQILAHNSGANYKGGFTVRNLSAESDAKQVVKSIDPIGLKGYETGGNYSTFNWLIPEKASDSAWRIYQYSPSGGIATYTLRDKLSDGVESIATDAPEAENLKVVCNNGILTVLNVPVEKVEIYSMSGMLMMVSASIHTDVSTLPAGLYLARVNNGAAAKFNK